MEEAALNEKVDEADGAEQNGDPSKNTDDLQQNQLQVPHSVATLVQQLCRFPEESL